MARGIGALLRREWALITLLVAAVVGMGVSLYLTSVHFLNTPLFCSTTGVIDCAPVLKSAFSVVPGTQLPITVPGFLWFGVSGGLAAVGLASVLRERPEPERLRLAQLAWAGLGLLFVLYLVYAELVQLHRICAWCTVVHVLTLVIFLIALRRLQQASAEPTFTDAPSLAVERRARRGAHAPTPAVPRRRRAANAASSSSRTARSGVRR